MNLYRTSFRPWALLAAALLASPVAVWAEDAGDGAREAVAAPLHSPVSEARVAEIVPQRRSSRLKFKDGPVCVCPTGLSERDIAAGRSVSTR